MNEGLLKLIEHIVTNDNWPVLALVAFLVLVFNLKSIQEFLEKQGTRKENFIKEAIELKSVSDSARKLLEEELDYLIVKKATGISADKYMREAILQILEKSKGDLQIFHFARAREHIRMKDKKLVIELGSIDWIQHKYHWFGAIFMALLAFIAFAAPIAAKAITAYQFATSYLLGFAAFAFSMFIVSQTIPYAIAKRIAAKLVKYQEPPLASEQIPTVIAPLCASAENLANAYDDNEPEYTLMDIRQHKQPEAKHEVKSRLAS